MRVRRYMERLRRPRATMRRNYGIPKPIGDNVLANIYVKKIWSAVGHTIHYVCSILV